MGQTLRYVELASPIMNTESMPLKHDHQQYADHPAAATTRTTLVTRALVVVCGVAAVVAGVTYLSTGSYPRSPVASGATGGVLLRDGSTSTPTQEAFIARYSELMDISPADQTIQYEAYLLYLNGMTVDELDAYYHTHDDGQQEGGGSGATSSFSCCKDKRDSSGCQTWGNRCVADQKYECEFAGYGFSRDCCRTFPDNRVGSKFWVWGPCT